MAKKQRELPLMKPGVFPGKLAELFSHFQLRARRNHQPEI
jgi:hypothetical protein